MKIVCMLLLFPLVALSQVTFKGKVVDKNTKRPIAYAGIYYISNEDAVGTTTDANGNFTLTLTEDLYQKYRITATGYTDILVDITYQQREGRYELTPQTKAAAPTVTADANAPIFSIGEKVDKSELNTGKIDGFERNTRRAGWFDLRKLKGNIALKKIHLYISDEGDDEGELILRFMTHKSKKFSTGVNDIDNFYDLLSEPMVVKCKKGWNTYEIPPVKMPKKAIIFIISQVDSNKLGKWYNQYKEPRVGVSLASYKKQVQSSVMCGFVNNMFYFSKYEDVPGQSVAIVLDFQY